MIDFDRLWEELYLNMTLEECEAIIKQVEDVRNMSTKMLEHLVELRAQLREVQNAHGSQMDSDAGSQSEV